MLHTSKSPNDYSALLMSPYEDDLVKKFTSHYKFCDWQKKSRTKPCSSYCNPHEKALKEKGTRKKQNIAEKTMHIS